MATGPEAHRQNHIAKWVIILGAIVACVVVIGLFTEGFGLHGTEQAPDTSSLRPTP